MSWVLVAYSDKNHGRQTFDVAGLQLGKEDQNCRFSSKLAMGP